MIVLPSERRGRGYDSIESCALPLSQTLLAVVLFLPLSPPIDQRQDRDRIARLRQRPITWGASEVRIGLSAGGRWIRTFGPPSKGQRFRGSPTGFGNSGGSDCASDGNRLNQE